MNKLFLFSIIMAMMCILFGYGCQKSNQAKEGKSAMAANTTEVKNLKIATFAGGCFWCSESDFEKISGVVKVISGYTGGKKENPTYEEVCSGLTGHSEAVLVVFDPSRVSFDQLLTVFWESHDPTQGMRQGADAGTQYRSAIYGRSEAQLAAARASRDAYQARLTAAGYGPITTEIASAGEFYYAEDYHQQYLAKNPDGYCGLGGTGIACPIGVDA